MNKKLSTKQVQKLTNLEKKFKKFRKQLATDENSTENIFGKITNRYKNNEIDYYDFIDQMHSHHKALYEYADYLTSTGIGKIEISDNSVVFTTRKENIRLIFNGKDRRSVPFDMINWGTYESAEKKVFDMLLFDGMVILDIGANIGWCSLLWGKTFKNSTIYAFEPVPENYNYLVSNISLNGLTNIKTHNFGLSDKDGLVEFYFYPGGACLASAKNVIGYKQATAVSCQIKTLDSFAEGLNKIDFIKCDVEGAELLVLKGGVKTIDKFKPIIVLELIYEWSKAFNYHPNDAVSYLKKLGYRAFLPSAHGLKEVKSHLVSDFDLQNYFFLHAKKHKNIINGMRKRVSRAID